MATAPKQAMIAFRKISGMSGNGEQYMTTRKCGLALLGLCIGCLTQLVEVQPARADRCFDRCMTRCHLPMGYRYCRNDCFHACDRRRRY